MISLHPEYYQQLLSDVKKTEYRRGGFVKTPVNAFVYCTSPVMEIGVYASFGVPVVGKPEAIAKIKELEAPGSFEMMMEWMKGFSSATAVPVESVKAFDPVAFSEIREIDPTFQPPQRFTYLDKNQKSSIS